MTLRLRIGAAQREALEDRQGFLAWAQDVPISLPLDPDEAVMLRVTIGRGTLDFEPEDAADLASAIIAEANALDEQAREPDNDPIARRVYRQWRDALGSLHRRVLEAARRKTP